MLLNQTLIDWYDAFLLIIRTKCIDLYQSSHTSRSPYVCLQLCSKVGHDVGYGVSNKPLIIPLQLVRCLSPGNNLR